MALFIPETLKCSLEFLFFLTHLSLAIPVGDPGVRAGAGDALAERCWRETDTQRVTVHETWCLPRAKKDPPGKGHTEPAHA